jgi:hypothetical protein
MIMPCLHCYRNRNEGTLVPAANGFLTRDMCPLITMILLADLRKVYPHLKRLAIRCVIAEPKTFRDGKEIPRGGT